MTTITAKIPNSKDVKVLKEILERFGIQYTVDESAESYVFTDAQLADFEKSKQEFLDGKTTAKSWDDIKKDLESVYP
ncbi:hypothetical protein [Sphingobacterium wenxiniae]|uniref:Addiction module component n=1 Tax=Sphingobacterium wenxiniae TaxID=683125 RepID=A0A1I6TFJ5_9SPHI|nr:hypothetical protein [Sphingobacterium wenxiniae]SFS87945.1 hypothetical protein SAMN05660206_106117 [Sphingobacterium wenxiniae]